MSWINRHKRIWRAAILLLLLVALMGPWVFEQINVPAQYPCSPPFIRLEGDFCGIPLSGMRIFFGMVGGFISIVVGFVSGATILAGRAGEFLGMFLYLMLLFLLFLPFISTLRLMRGGDLRRSQVYHVAVWGLAAVSSSLFLDLSGVSRLHWAPWGLWFYVGLAVSALILELLVLMVGRRASQG
jgi:hypothetical protein